MLTLLIASSAFLPLNGATMDTPHPCDRIPAGAPQSCIDCMNDECDEYQAAIVACGDDKECLTAAKLAYDLGLLSCDCDPAARGAIAELVLKLPSSQQSWILESWQLF